MYYNNVKKISFLIICSIMFFVAEKNFSKNYAVLFSAGVATADDVPLNSEYWSDLFTTYKSLYENGFDHNSIYVLYGDGVDFVSSVDSFKVPSRWNRSNITDYSNTLSNLQSVLFTLAGTMTSNDNLYFWWTGHGDTVGTAPYLKLKIQNRNGVDSLIYDYQLAGYINQINNYNKRYISIMACFSGGIVDNISNNNSTIIYTSAPSDKPCLTGTFEGYPHTAFSYYIASALNWKTPAGTTLNADYNSDGLINLEEAFTLMCAYDPARGIISRS